MDFIEILHCKNCQVLFDLIKHKPLLLKCGHTFCESCLNSLYDSEKILCPSDSLPSDFEEFTDISVNYLILEVLETQKSLQKPEKSCFIHKTQQIRFFCETDKALLCQECLILGHLGVNHVILPSESIVLIEPLKQDIEKMLIQLKSDIQRIVIKIDENTKEAKKTENYLNNMKENLEKLIEKNYNELLNKKQKEFDLETKKIQKFQEKTTNLHEKAKEIQLFLSKIPSEVNYITNSDAPLLETLKTFQFFLLENSDFVINLPQIKPFFSFPEPPLLSKQEITEIITQQIPTYDKKNRKLLTFLKEEGVLKSDLVFHTMMSINRRNFVPESMQNRAYQDNPLSIGWNTTISAPHMHAQTLEELKGNLKKGGKGLDIGCGSGYITACMAEIMGENSKVFGLDHIEDIVNFARNNISKKNQYLIDKKRVEFVKADGRKGYVEEAPFDVIHVGGAIANVPEELLNQLAKGGRMWIPVGPAGCQAIYVYDKDLIGNVKNQKLCNVSYGMLTNAENQLQQQMF